jgi:hypothetical protein
MSGYPDERPDGPRPLDPREMQTARQAVTVPGVLLVATGLFSLFAAGLALVQLPQLPAKIDQFIAQIEADPKIPKEQKDTWKELLTSVKEAAEEPSAAGVYIAQMVASLVVLVGGVKLIRLSGRGFPIAGSVIAMIPCTVGCCCLLGLPAGLWSLVVLTRPDVKAAFATRRTGPPADPDAQYLR